MGEVCPTEPQLKEPRPKYLTYADSQLRDVTVFQLLISSLSQGEVGMCM